MGVKIGTQELPAPAPKQAFSLDDVLSGQEIETSQGHTYLIETNYPIGQSHGNYMLELQAPLDILGQWAGEERIVEFPIESFAFLDTETTGLSGGAGTQAFLVGIGRFTGGEFRLRQYFLRDPIEEPAQLAACEEFLAPCQAVVTFNGKSFDIPLMISRFNFHGWRHPFAGMAHIDLLHLARRLWSDRLPSRTLLNLETHILGSTRTEEDIPGWMAPALYFEYLRYGDPSPLKSIVYHNAMDVISLAALLDYMAALLSNPREFGENQLTDLIAIARLFEDMGDYEQATRLYLDALDQRSFAQSELPMEVLLNAVMRLARIYKRQEDFSKAIVLWEEACEHAHLEAHIELAKYYEHREKDFRMAIHWTKTAMVLLESSNSRKTNGAFISHYEELEWQKELEHRLERVERKFKKDL